MSKPESETDPWKFFHLFTCASNRQTIAGGAQACDCGLDAARAAEAAQHQEAMKRQTDDFNGLCDTIQSLRARLAAVAAERDRLKAALQDVTTGMDRAGGDRDGMPECPWCQSQGDYDHSGDCALVAARAALTPQGQSTDGETR